MYIKSHSPYYRTVRLWSRGTTVQCHDLFGECKLICRMAWYPLTSEAASEMGIDVSQCVMKPHWINSKFLLTMQTTWKKKKPLLSCQARQTFDSVFKPQAIQNGKLRPSTILKKKSNNLITVHFSATEISQDLTGSSTEHCLMRPKGVA